MQDAFSRDMFNASDLNNSRYNGHIQVTSFAKGGGGKKDRKGCNKGKIEAIMKNNSVRPKVCVPSPVKKSSSPGRNHVIVSKHLVKSESSDQEDPYTFTEPEPHSLSTLYQAGGSSAPKKPPPPPPPPPPPLPLPSTQSRAPPAMVCIDKNKLEPPRLVVKQVKPLEATSKMNKLQADIARNKVIGKRKKVEQVPSSGKSSEWINVIVKRDPNKVCLSAKRDPRKSLWQRERNPKHELLERIHSVQSSLKLYKRDLYPLGLELSDSDSDESDNKKAIYERHWFSRIAAKTNVCSNSEIIREKRVEETRAELRRKLTQTLRGVSMADPPNQSLLNAVIKAARRFPNATAAVLDPALVKPAHKAKKGAKFLVSGEKCSYAEGCNWQALPSTRHCIQHIMYNVDQRLFSHCTAKYSDNTQCSMPVFDIRHELPLCPKHATQSENAKKYSLEYKSHKKVSKKNRILSLSRSNKRNNKKRKKSTSSSSSSQTQLPQVASEEEIVDTHFSSRMTTSSQGSPQPPLIDTTLAHVQDAPEDIVGEVSEEVLAIANLDPTELANQATRLLEEHDLTNMLNQISTDAFSDLFADKNGEYEPTREETEELERALEAVNQDVRSLERMTRALPLLQLPLDPMALLDDTPPTGPFPPFQNGFTPPATTDIHHT